MSTQADTAQPKAIAPLGPINLLPDAWSYGVDAFQRGILFLDVMRQRSERYEEHATGERAIRHRA